MKHIIPLMMLILFIFACSTTPVPESEPEESQPVKEEKISQNEEAIPPVVEGLFICTSLEDRTYEIRLEAPLDKQYLGKTLMVKFYEGPNGVSGMGGTVNRERILYQFVSGYTPREGKTNRVEIFLDENENFNKERVESGRNLTFDSIADMEEGISFAIEGLSISVPNQASEPEKPLRESTSQSAYKSFVYPRMEDISINSPPGFSEREGERGIGILDYSLNCILWFYRDTTLEQISELMGKAPDQEWPKGGPGLGTFKFEMADGGFILFGFDEGGLWMVYPRNTHWFTLAGFPRLPWDYEDVHELFGPRVAGYLTEENRGDEIFPFQINGEPEPKELPAFRIDISEKENVVNGFRCWMPGESLEE